MSMTLRNTGVIEGLAVGGLPDNLYLEAGVLHVRDQKAAATLGGTNAAGDQVRTLNTVVTNTITGASLASNQVTLPAGTYRVFGRASAYAVNRHRARLYNVTDAANAILGSSEINNAADSVSNHSHFTGVPLVIAATKVFELRHFMQSFQVNSGLGVDSTDGFPEVYSELIFWKVA